MRRYALLISRGDPTVFFTRPISLSFMLVTLLLIILMIAPMMRKKRAEVYDGTAQP